MFENHTRDTVKGMKKEAIAWFNNYINNKNSENDAKNLDKSFNNKKTRLIQRKQKSDNNFLKCREDMFNDVKANMAKNLGFWDEDVSKAVMKKYQELNDN